MATPHVYLIGYRGCGKTTLGRQLAEKLRWPFVDTDVQIENEVGRSIRKIFADDGEDRFRQLEQLTLASVAARAHSSVVATGGGAILRVENRQVMLDTGHIVYLRASADILWQRISQDPTTGQRRPNLSGCGGYEEVVAILRQRKPIYEQLSQKTVQTDSQKPDDIVAEIAAWVKSRTEDLD